ncbi:MAG: hypothetical protein KF795_00275 [Labilithrix sp.]|nr:hypothetical protein [Labilithrix sp.]
MLPSVSIFKSDGNTGVVKPSADGILAIIAPSQHGTPNQPGAFARRDLALAEHGFGPLVEVAAYHMDVAGKPVVLIRSAASTAATAGTVTTTGGGTATHTVATPANILDDFDILITYGNGGTQGVAGITYTTSLDGGLTNSPFQALGTATSLTIPNSGVTVDVGAGTILPGQKVSFSTKGPRSTNADLVDALEALRTYGGAWSDLLVVAEADATMVATLDLWLSAREAEGKFKTFVANAVPRDAATQTEAQYATAMTAAFGSASSIRGCVCADQGYVVSSLRGIRMRRPVSIGFAARGMASDISRDAAFVADGPIAGYQIADDRGNPLFHDEALYPGLDDLRLTTLRSFHGREGTFITNPLLLSPSGSDYVFWQHARVMNKACDIAFQLLTNRLSQGVRKDRATGFILEEDAQEIEALVQAELDKQLVTPGRVSGAVFLLSRTDDLSSNAGAVLNAEIQVSALAYVKRFAVTSKFVKRIVVPPAA